eukprot:m.88540 g.88540  ORF g.88540 m.88540 type:complete len:64 (-) comp26208_c3_seq1:177-368(-)
MMFYQYNLKANVTINQQPASTTNHLTKIRQRSVIKKTKTTFILIIKLVYLTMLHEHDTFVDLD